MTFSRTGMEVTPVLSYNEDGSEFVSDFAVDDYERGGEINSAEYANIPDGPDYYEDPDTDAEYVDALMTLNPEIPDAVAWANATQDQEWIDWYNAAIDSDDYGELNAAIDELLTLYANADEYDPDEVDASEEYESELSQEQYETATETIAELQETEPSFAESFEFDDAAMRALDAGNQCIAEAATLAAQFHREEIDANSAITYMLENYSYEELEQAIDYLGL